MAARSLGLAAAFGAAANAILLEPAIGATEVTHGKVHTLSDQDLWTVVDWKVQPVLVPCMNCESEKTANKNLLVNISVGAQPGTLELGGTVVYPPSAYMVADHDTKPTVIAVPADVSMTDALASQDQYTSVPVSGLAVVVVRPETEKSATGEELLMLDLILSGVDNEKSEVPRVTVNVVRQADDSLTILSATAHDATEPPVPGHKEHKAGCVSTFCQWRQFIEDKFSGISAAAHKQIGHGRPCPGKMREMMKGGKMLHGGPFTNMHHGPGSYHHRPMGEAGRPHHHHGHPKMHHGPHHHGFKHFMHQVGRFIMAVAIPILIGIAAGVLTYAIGMVVGMVIALIWIKVFRGGKKGYASVALTEDDAALKEAEEIFEARESFESAPPVYEDAPAYEEKEVV